MTDSPASVPVAPGSPTLRLRERIRYNLALLDLRGRGFVLIGGLILLAWISSGIYKVQPDEQGIVLRFGRWQQTAESGLHYHLPFPVETVLLPKITQVNQLQLGSGSSTQGSASNGARDKQMLTGDENIVEADCTVFWRIKDAGAYLFKISDPERSVKIAAESAL